MPRLAVCGTTFPATRSRPSKTLGWDGIKNGRLLALAQADFQIFVTGDRNLSFQQNLPRFAIAVVVLKAESIRLIHTRPLMLKVLALLPSLKPGQLITVAP